MTELRRRSVLGLGIAAAGVAVGVPVERALRPDRSRISLYSGGVGITMAGQRVLLKEGEFFPRKRSRVLDDDGSSEVALTEQELLASAEAAVAPEWRELVGSSVLDLNVLSHGLPAPVAAWNDPWRYVWPRDAAHVVRTWARLGRAEDVMTWLRFLSEVQREDGRFEARTTLLGGVPDDRPVQADGVGWFLWAIAEACDLLPSRRSEILELTGYAAGAGLRAVLADLDRSRDGLPSPTPDYWEVPERRTTLGIAAVTLSGLQAAARLGEELCPEAARAGGAAERLMGTIRTRFGARGYQRYVRGGGQDSAITFLLPPYVRRLDSEVAPLLETAWQAMLRPAGGIAPGEGWRQDGISWTPETALFAQAHAALGDHERAGRILNWLALHRTPAGALPEKVLHDGSPAAVAPLAWTCAVVASTALDL